MEKDDNREARPTQEAPRRPYQKPRLTRFGSLADITRANASGGKNDGAKGNTKT
jgi:hypothetical protein